jgi:prevent-host-death family protein
MLSLGADEARRRLPELLKRAEEGEQTLIQRHGHPVAALVPLHQRFTPQRQALLSLRGSGRGLWTHEPVQPATDPGPTRQAASLEPTIASLGFRTGVAFDTPALMAFLAGDGRACRDLEPWIQAISEGRSRGALSARSLNRLQVGALQAGKPALAERYGAVFGEPSFWSLMPLNAGTAAMAARLEVQLQLPAASAEDLACAIASGSLCLLSADPALIALAQQPGSPLPEGLQLVPIHSPQAAKARP